MFHLILVKKATAQDGLKYVVDTNSYLGGDTKKDIFPPDSRGPREWSTHGRCCGCACGEGALVNLGGLRAANGWGMGKRWETWAGSQRNPDEIPGGKNVKHYQYTTNDMNTNNVRIQ